MNSQVLVVEDGELHLQLRSVRSSSVPSHCSGRLLEVLQRVDLAHTRLLLQSPVRLLLLALVVNA